MSAEQSPKIVIVDESPIRAAILDRCQDAAYVWNTHERMTRMDPRREAVMRTALDELVASGRVHMIRAADLAVYIAW